MMTNLKMTLVAAAVAVVAGSANAVVFTSGQNSIFYANLENQYRSNAVCAVLAGSCLGAGSGPTGFQLVNPTIIGNVVVGDVFAGVINVQNIAHAGGPWLQTPTDQFSGYFAQEVSAVSVGSAAEIDFKNPTTDPFGILAAGEMFRLYTQQGGGTTIFDKFTGGTAASVIGLATDGTFWGSLGITAGKNGGYAYSIDDLTAPGTSTTTEAFLGLNFTSFGVGCGAGTACANGLSPGTLKLLNDINESIRGGITATQVCTAADIANPLAICTQFIATSEIELNDQNILFGSGASPFIFESNDPAVVNLQPIPEPGSLALLGLGLLSMFGLRRRKA